LTFFPLSLSLQAEQHQIKARKRSCIFLILGLLVLAGVVVVIVFGVKGF
jgi:hypothetical protein